ncbi:hypothetical protein PoB_006140500 [Plakobranchus ocellatus]|uniref:Uncharacterized protein n=1 Tax=Plakobranchus ocellatus TaxID=259542 RepID=A0AAV4CSS3_9GAST|nr:hypothetical protein PoB_006140500 [Plakobranchus ocellatus]
MAYHTQPRPTEVRTEAFLKQEKMDRRQHNEENSNLPTSKQDVSFTKPVKNDHSYSFQAVHPNEHVLKINHSTRTSGRSAVMTVWVSWVQRSGGLIKQLEQTKEEAKAKEVLEEQCLQGDELPSCALNQAGPVTLIPGKSGFPNMAGVSKQFQSHNMPKKSHFSHDIVFDGALLSTTRASLVTELLKYFLYERQQIPLPVDQLESLVENSSRSVNGKENFNRSGPEIQSHPNGILNQVD